MRNQHSILVAGGGIGGLTTALALAKAGNKVSIYERSAEFLPVGAGLQLSANALSVLDSLGISMKRKGGIEIKKVEVRDGHSGKLITRIATPEQFKTIVLSRADLHAILLNEVSSSANITLHQDAHVVDVLGGKDVVSLKLENGSMDSGDALIGADGVWSQTRRFVNTGRPEYSGRIAWRAIMPISAVPEGIARHTVTLWLAPNSHLVTYPIANGTYFNAVAISQGNWQAEGWSMPGEMADLALAFSNWNRSVQTMVQTTEGWLKWALCAIDPNLDWTKDRIALMGDAAHAMVPFMAQGAGMSIEDAWALTHYISRSSAKDLPDALGQYQQSRQERVAKVWETSMRQGKIYHMSGIMRSARNLAMQLGGPMTANRYNWIYDWRP